MVRFTQTIMEDKRLCFVPIFQVMCQFTWEFERTTIWSFTGLFLEGLQAVRCLATSQVWRLLCTVPHLAPFKPAVKAAQCAAFTLSYRPTSTKCNQWKFTIRAIGHPQPHERGNTTVTPVNCAVGRAVGSVDTRVQIVVVWRCALFSSFVGLFRKGEYQKLQNGKFCWSGFPFCLHECGELWSIY